jgi:hypothetical protein
MNRIDPGWLPETRDLCRQLGITIMAWGPDMLTVEAKSATRAKEIAAQLGHLGFKAIENEDDAYAGMLSLSKNPDAVQAQVAAFNISRRRWDEQMEPLIWAACAIGFLISGLNHSGRYPPWFTLPAGAALTVLFFWDAARIWGWKLEILPDALRVRRRFRWTMIQWDQIRKVESLPRGRNQERVVLHLVSHSAEPLGTFGGGFARNLRDRLRQELARRH